MASRRSIDTTAAASINGIDVRGTGAEPIAILGMGCRFPGGAKDPDRFWKLLTDKVDAVREVPEDRWSSRTYFSPPPHKPGKTISRWGGFLDDVDRFDAAFFGISPREAAAMDPQQRLLLEVAWEALEEAGLPVDALAGRRVGVFVGASSNDYIQLQWDRFHGGTVNAYTNVGGALSILANRLSYLWDLRGPSLTVDTACSSSLVGLHYACQSLCRGESELALVAGVNMILLPAVFVAFSQAQMLSPDGRCRSFDARANGYARAEGVGAVVLKPLGQALADGDPIQAVVLATGVNQDGRTTGISFPNERAQATLLREVYERAGIDPRQVGYVEAHGTGTPVGDPVEARAVGGVLGVGRPPQAALPMGSVKSNFGHLEPASGMAGVIKAVLSLKHRQLVPSLHYESPNPAIDFAGLGLRVVTQQEAWQEPPTGRRIAAVNSFGFGGTNAHAVLAEVLPPAPGIAESEVSCQDRISTTASSPSAEDASAASGRGPSWLVPLSARSDAALQALAQSWIDWLASLPLQAGPDLEAIAYTAAVRRMHHDHRLAIAARDTSHLRELIEAWSRGERRREISCGRVAPIAHQDASRDGRPARAEGAEQDVRAGSSLRIAFVFNGMGSQWQGMGQELLETEPEFRQAVERVDQIFRELSGWSIAEQLQRDEFRSRINETEVTQPAIFAVQVGLAALWRSWGVEPALVVGHSVGEAAAACVAGALTLEDAVRVIFHRSRLQHRLRGQGRMLALGIPADMAASLVAGYGGRVEIGAVNSPVSVTLSGEREALEELQYAMESAQTFCRFLPVDVPYHSSRMEAIESEFRQAIIGIQSRPPAVRYFSTVTGQAADESPLDADYWWGNIRRPVLFASAMQTLLAAGAEAVIEIGSHPVLSHSIRECADGATASLDVLPSMRRNEPQQAELLSSLGRLHTLGHPVRWERLFPQRRAVVRLPSYPWQRESYWSESEENRWSRLGLGNPAGGLLARIQHPLLGQDVQTTGDQRIFHGRLDLNGPHAWLADHQVQGAVVFPAAGYVELALAAGKQLHPEQPLCLESVEIHRPLALTADRNATLETVIDPLSGDLAIRSRDSDGGGPRYASCTVRADFGEWGERPADLAGLAQACAEPLAIGSLYDEFRRIGLNYGPCFRGIEEVRTGPGRAFGRVRLPEGLQAEAAQYVLCPAVLDACLQMVICAAHQDLAGPAAGTLYLPVRLKRLRLRDLAAISQLSRTGLTVETRLTERTASLVRADIFLFDSSGRAVGEIEGLEAVAFPVAREGQIALEDCLWVHRWELRAQQAESASDGMPPPQELANDVAPRIAELCDPSERRRWYQEMLPELERVAAAFAADALQRLGLEFRAGEAFTSAELGQRLGVADRQERLLDAMLRALVWDGRLQATRGGYQVVDRLAGASGLARWQAAAKRWAALHSSLLLLERTGTQLDGVLRGDVNSLDLVFPDGSSSIVEQVYEDSPGFRVYNGMLQQVFAALVARLPAERCLRVLEIGGGTGSASSFILPTLPAERTEYVFTDLSPQFLALGEQKLREFACVRYAVLDLEKDPREQGFEPHSFDVILGADVVHATTDIRRALQGIRSLLAPEGLLVLMEPVRRQAAFDMTFGVLRGWWHFTDTDLRTDSPLLSRERWIAVLEETGYREVAVLSDPVPNEESVHAIFLARPPETPPSKKSSTASPAEERRAATLVAAVSQTRLSLPTWWMIADRGGIAPGLARRHREAGGEVVVVTFGEEYREIEPGWFQIRAGEPRDVQMLCGNSAAARVPEAIVHLASLDAPAGEAFDVEVLRQAQMAGAYSLPSIVQGLVEARWSPSPRLWMVTRGVHSVGLPAGTETCLASAPLWGLARTLTNEIPELRCSLIDLSPVGDEAELDSLYRELAHRGEETEVVLRGARRYVPRLARGAARLAEGLEGSDSFHVEVDSPGILDSVALRPVPRTGPGPGEVEIEVEAAALNFKDVAKSLNLLSEAMLRGTWSQTTLGLECAGRISALGAEVTGLAAGDRVVALAADCFRPRVTTRAELVRRLPEHISCEEAAGLPVVFLTAQYALNTLAQLQAGQRVLIHAAAGGVGLAAIQIAQAAGAEVIATAGSPFKREYLRALGVPHVLDSRSLAFVDDVRRVTGGQGVDVVLNSLSGAAIPASLSLLRTGGRFVEIGKRDIQENARLGLRPFDKNLALFALDLDRLLAERPDLTGRLFDSLSASFHDRTLSPVACRTFPISRVAEAFRYVAKARHIGKVVLRMRDPMARARPRDTVRGTALRFDPQASYLVTGGLGGFGLATARWLVQRGAKHLVLLSRRGAETSETQEAVEGLQAAGASVTALAVDVSDEPQLRQALARIRRELPPLKGVFHAAMVLDDALVNQLSVERMEKVFAPKAWGAWHLHQLTKDDPLEHFVLFSSATTDIGNPGQANYVAACTLLDQLARYRRAHGRPALSVAWGAIRDVGYLTRNQELLRRAEERVGLRAVAAARLLDFLAELMCRPHARAAVFPIDWSRFQPRHFPLASTPRLLPIASLAAQQAVESLSGAKPAREALLEVPPEERAAKLRSYLVEVLAGVLGTSPARIETDRSVLLMGLDSLMAVELQTRVTKELGCELSSMRLLGGPTLNELTEELLAQLMAER